MWFRKTPTILLWSVFTWRVSNVTLNVNTLTYLCILCINLRILGTCKCKAARLESLIARHSLKQANIIFWSHFSLIYPGFYKAYRNDQAYHNSIHYTSCKPCGCRIGIRLSDSWLEIFYIFWSTAEKSPMFTPGSILTLSALILAVVSILGVLLFQIGTFYLCVSHFG